jgi:hypothetical protein
LTITMLGKRIKEALEQARTNERVLMTPAAMERWKEIYKALSIDQPGLLGAITARAEAQTLRLALVYALTDGVGEIDVVHLDAALALWRYCETSAKIIFGDTVGDPLADEILRALRSCLITGMMRTDLYLQFKYAHRAIAIGTALSRLLQLGRVRCERSANPGPGRPSETWFATAAYGEAA